MAFVTAPLTIGRGSFVPAVANQRFTPSSQRVASAKKTRTLRVTGAPRVMGPRMESESPTDVPDVLKKILERKATEVAALKEVVSAAGDSHPIATMLDPASRPRTRSKRFYNALNKRKGTLTVIAEIKRKSPSKGLLAEIKDPTMLSRTYHEGGAAAISVLTDEEGFGGTMDDLEKVVDEQAKHHGDYPGPCPVLRKDFIIDEIQIAEAACGGASAVLLIMAALGADRCKELLNATHDLGLDALVEVHDKEELDKAIAIGAEIVGVNNRDLRTFDVNLDTSLDLADDFPDGVIRVAESGIATATDAWKLRDAGYQAVLVGEVLVKAFYESSSDSTSYTVGYNQAKGYIKAFRAKGSVDYAPASTAAFFGKGEGAKERLGEIAM